ncbi:MAG: DUF370 domain-containing protein [Clostridiales bacterium]|nr:DUF370 domain-containing protein [Clostridiales bacterium]
MYLYLGQNIVVSKKNVVGIFDLDNASSSHITREFLARAERKGQVFDISGELPKVFAVCERKGETIVYLSQLSSATLLKRWESDTFAGP